MKRYQISHPYEKRAFPVRWNEVPDQGLQAKQPIFDLFEFQPGVGLRDISVFYFRSVRKFKEGIKEVEDTDNKIIYGIL